LEVLSIRNLSKTYTEEENPVHALRDISFAIVEGEFVGLSGPSGSGKSSLLNILGLTDSPSTGELFLCGKKIDFTDGRSLVAYRRSQLGYIFQYFNLIPSLTAVENVALTALLNGCTYSEAEEKARQLLGKVGLTPRCDHLPEHLSGGEMQRVAFCRAIVHQPKVLLADEPTGNLDSDTGAQIILMLKALAAEGTAVVMATHNDSALRQVSRRLNLRDGVLV
jgi:ABC-type lipoprotein export system ATPase subunit